MQLSKKTLNQVQQKIKELTYQKYGTTQINTNNSQNKFPNTYAFLGFVNHTVKLGTIDVFGPEEIILGETKYAKIESKKIEDITKVRLVLGKHSVKL